MNLRIPKNYRFMESKCACVKCLENMRIRNRIWEGFYGKTNIRSKNKKGSLSSHQFLSEHFLTSYRSRTIFIVSLKSHAFI